MLTITSVPAQRRRGRKPVALTGPDPVDIHVGSRLRERRLSLGWSQSQLGRALNLTFQQIQKYERGTNRVSASMLYKAAEAMEVPVSFFFDGYGDLPLEPVPASAVTLGEGSLARSVAALPPDVRDGFKQLVEGLVSKRVS